MKIEDHLSDNTKKEMHKKAKRSRKKNEKLSFKDMERMMGKYDQTLHRGKGGAWK